MKAAIVRGQTKCLFNEEKHINSLVAMYKKGECCMAISLPFVEFNSLYIGIVFYRHESEFRFIRPYSDKYIWQLIKDHQDYII